MLLAVTIVAGVTTAAGGQTEHRLRIAARRHTDGSVEVALQQQRPDSTWGDRILPALRIIPANARSGRRLASSPLAEPEPLDEAEPLGDPDARNSADPAGSGPTEDGDSGSPRALMSPTGVPVAVLRRTAGGYLVRTPCGNTTVITTGDPIEAVRVVLDPGHGGRFERGAAVPNGLFEHTPNLRLSNAILAELAGRGIPAATTRTGNYGSLLSVRAAFAEARFGWSDVEDRSSRLREAAPVASPGWRRVRSCRSAWG